MEPLRKYTLWMISGIIATSSVAAPVKPNIALVYIDDWAWNGSSAAMHPDMPNTRMPAVKTPSLDRMAREGRICQNAYGTQQCAPARACLLLKTPEFPTGEYFGIIEDSQLKICAGTMRNRGNVVWEPPPAGARPGSVSSGPHAEIGAGHFPHNRGPGGTCLNEFALKTGSQNCNKQQGTRIVE